MKRRNLECTLLILALLLSLFSVSAFAAPNEEKAALEMENVAINEFDSTYYNDGGTVINNFGIVYNNGGTVYNNGGTVFNNEGTVYNNGGIVFNNGALVYNNGGTVHNNNGGTVYEASAQSTAKAPVAEEAPVAEAPAPETVPAAVIAEEPTPQAEPESAAGQAPAGESAEAPAPAAAAEAPASEKPADVQLQGYIIEMTGDYSRLAEIEGLEELDEGRFVIEPEGVAVIRARAGLRLTDSFTTAGRCTVGSEGQISLTNVDRNGRLTLKFLLEAPEVSLASGSYDDEKTVILSVGAEGAKILYTLNGASPLESGKEYKKPLKIEKSVKLRAVAVMDGAVSSSVTERVYVFPELEEPEFKDVRVGYGSVKAQPIVLVNTGLDTVYVESVRLEGVHRDCFVLSSEKGGRVATGQRDSKSWSIAPADGLEAGEYEAEIVFLLAGGDRLTEDVSFTVRK